MVGPSSQISKILLTLLFLLIIFYVYMDVLLYLRIQNYPIERGYNLNNSIASNNNNMERTVGTITTHQPLSSATSLFMENQKSIKYSNVTWINCHINPLCDVTVKALMLDHTNHYIFAPLATIFDDIVGFSRSNLITPNMISFFHVFVAALAGRMIASDNLGSRRFGTVLFQFRTFLDDLDGHVARTKKGQHGEHSEIGTMGYYIDGLCDGLGCIALMIGVFVFLKNNVSKLMIFREGSFITT